VNDIVHIDPKILAMWNRSVPRYTSYPTAPQFYPLDPPELKSDQPISIYIHIPFCKTMCLFCGCSVILNRNPERQSDYLAHLIKEISLIPKHQVSQLHLGG
jgi:oxygen-independent coproporphyrinogen-3 oxidase